MKGKQRISWVSVMKRIALGGTVSIGCMLLICAVGAAMILGGSLEESSYGYLSALALILGSCLGAWIASAGQNTGRFIICVIHGVVWYAVLFCAGVLIFDTPAQGTGTTALLCIGSSSAAGLVTLRKKGRHAPGKRPYKFRRIVHNAQ